MTIRSMRMLRRDKSSLVVGRWSLGLAISRYVLLTTKDERPPTHHL
jgi:hypothetical protein